MVQHGGFITEAFLVTGTVLAGTIAAVLIDYRVQLRTLRRLLLDHSDPRGRV
jgi:heme exporter protein CcmD